MAKKRQNPPPTEHQFKPGWKGGPGRPGMPPEVKALKMLTRDDLIAVAMMVFQGDVVQLMDLMKRLQHEDPEQRPTPIQALMASCLLVAIKNGDSAVLNSLLDRFFGRAPIAIQVTTPKEDSGSTAKTIVFETVATPIEPPDSAATG